MEPLFLAVACGCQAGRFRDALHEVYLPRIQRGDAAYSAKVLGARGALLSVLAYFFEEDRWGSPAQRGVEGQSLTAEDQLFVLMQAGMYLTATRGNGTPDSRACFERAEALCNSLNRPLHLYSALMGQWLFSLHTDKMAVTMQLARRVFGLAQEQNDAALMVGGYRALAVTWYYLGNFEAAEQYARRGVELWRLGAVQSPVEQVNPPAVICLGYAALCEWHLGETASCQTAMAETIRLAKELSDAYALAEALFFAAMLGHFERNAAEVERLASGLIEVCTRHNFALYLAGGEILRGQARSASGHSAEGIACIEDGIRDWRASGSRLLLPYWLALKAEALHLADRSSEALESIREAEALGEGSEECWCSAELHRLRGVFLATLGADAAQIEASFCEAVRIARQQKSISLTKRAEESYAEHRSQKA
jgi:predicted ATPase